MIKKRRKEFCRCCTQGSLYSEGNSMPSAPVRAMLDYGACVLVWGNLGILFLLHSLPVSFIPQPPSPASPSLPFLPSPTQRSLLTFLKFYQTLKTFPEVTLEPPPSLFLCSRLPSPQLGRSCRLDFHSYSRPFHTSLHVSMHVSSARKKAQAHVGHLLPASLYQVTGF